MTPRQKEVYALLIKGWPNKDIALELDIREVTIKQHVRNICIKHNVRTRTGLLAKIITELKGKL